MRKFWEDHLRVPALGLCVLCVGLAALVACAALAPKLSLVTLGQAAPVLGYVLFAAAVLWVASWVVGSIIAAALGKYDWLP